MPGLDNSFDLGEIIEHLHEGLQVIGPDFTYLYLNAAAAAHGQASASELLGKRMQDAYAGIERTEMFARLERVLEDGGELQLENEFAFPDGSKRWFELRMRRIPQGVMILSVDITDRKRLESRIHRAERMDAVGQLAGGVAHDFNNILTIIHSHAHLVRSEAELPGELSGDIQQILDATHRGAELTRKLLTFARQMPVGARSVPVDGAVSDLARLLKRVLGENVLLETEVHEEVGSVWMDPTAFDQIFVNLAINARDAMPEGGNLTIEAAPVVLTESWSQERAAALEPGEYAMISVTDTGMGIPPDVLDRVFEPFFTTKEGSGTGLGLATCWGLAGQAGGTITVYTEEGRGTTFRVYLPRTDERPQPRPSEPGPVARPSEARVMVVEDDAGVRAVICRILRREGLKVLEASTPGDAMLLAEDIGDRLDLLLTDVVMPRMSGVELSERLRRRFPHLRVLIMSGFAPRALARDGHVVPDDPFLAKPFTPAALIAAVVRALE